jgi:hypothetical protein
MAKFESLFTFQLRRFFCKSFNILAIRGPTMLASLLKKSFGLYVVYVTCVVHLQDKVTPSTKALWPGASFQYRSYWDRCPVHLFVISSTAYPKQRATALVGTVLKW